MRMKISREQGVHSKKRVRPTTRALSKEGTGHGEWVRARVINDIFL